MLTPSLYAASAHLLEKLSLFGTLLSRNRCLHIISMTSLQPRPGTLTKLGFAQLLQFYPHIQQVAYRSKIKDPKKLAIAQQDHDWRYDELPKLVAQRGTKSSPAYLEKEELVRLIQWKIVHGQNRPFLPGMVKKNEGQRVKDVLSSAFGIQAGASYGETEVPESLDRALREAAQLHGIGPATATLICSINDPTNVAFFEDELAEWLCPDIPKLKYTWAEYKSLFTQITKLRNQMGLDHKAVDIEKVGFVVGHFHLLDDEQREAVASFDQEGRKPANATRENLENSTAAPRSSERDMSLPRASRIKGAAAKRKAKAEEDVPAIENDGKPRAKRNKK